MRIAIKELIGERCLTLEDGQRVYDAILPSLQAGEPVELDFAGVRVFLSLFFNAAIGQLLNTVSRDDLNRLVRVVNLSADGNMVLRRVIKNASQYYTNPDVRRIVDEIIELEAQAG